VFGIRKFLVFSLDDDRRNNGIEVFYQEDRRMGFVGKRKEGTVDT